MSESSNIKRTIFRTLVAIGIIVWCAFTLNTGLYVDENGLLTIYKGIYQGQHMFTDSWESLQTGGFLAWPLLALYYQVLSPLFLSVGINIGLVLYMRIVYMVVRGLIALYLFYTIKNTKYENSAYYAALFYFMFVVTWKNFSYKSYCEMAVMMIICFMIRYYETEKVRYFVLMGIACCVGILGYPTMIIMAVFIGCAIIFGMYQGQVPGKALVAFVITCLVIGGAFILYLHLTSGLPQAISELQFLGDQDYEESVAVRLGKLLLSYAALAVVAYFPIVVINLIRKARYFSEYAEAVILTIYWVAFLVGICLLKWDGVSNSRFVYACIILFFWLPYFLREKEKSSYTRIGAYNNTLGNDKGILWMMFTVSVAAQLIWCVSTNQDISVPGHMSVYAVIAVLIIAADDEMEMIGLVRFVIAAATFFLCFWVAEGNGGYSDVTKERWIVTEGELKGIALLPEDYMANQSVYNLVSQYVGEDDYLLVAFGSNSTGYLNSVAHQGTYSVYARTQKNTKLLDYYTLHPENMADYVLIDQSNVKYEAFREGETGLFLLNTYTKEIATDGNFVLLGRGDAQ
ncbi:glycosyltransferase family 39 protein [Pseudobutyrivibrio ruminis]|uniref:glycosyltransferase family 39 protein n=1 Tax=Pseudobutyrivibrio ruminis TaxID=46206 RepID=UPI00051B27BD|nr:hypothetical protein [Pseudobutyrivibrio ruminis]